MERVQRLRFMVGFKLFAVCFAMLCMGCASGQFSDREEPTRGVKYSDAYGPARPSEVIPRTVTTAEFERSLGTGRGVHGARFVQVFRREGGYPEWRIFDVRPGDPFTLVGMREGDVLVAANDWIIFDPQRFRAYVELLRSGFEASILIRRDGALTELRPKLVDAGSGSSSSASLGGASHGSGDV